MKAILEIARRHRDGSPVGIPSVCSAHPAVVSAALEFAREHGLPTLIESTSNQVNQFGGYTGMRPADFRQWVLGKAAEAGVPATQVMLGGDHLGPNCWQGEPAASAMAKAQVLIEEYVAAGFRKIHLDCSMACADDPPVLSDAVVAARAALLCSVAEATWQRVGGEPPVYVVGTEVPVPGGAKEEIAELQATDPAALDVTLETHQRAFEKLGLQSAWLRVVGVVVQPGVEFDHQDVVDFEPDRAASLSEAIARHPRLIYEAHSTDYQTPGALRSLVQAHFAILKVGPGLTFALRETLWALAAIEDELVPSPVDRSNLRQVLIDEMLAQPGDWKKYFEAGDDLRARLQFSLSDRSRYYWNRPAVDAACEKLLTGLAQRCPSGVPLSLLSQYLPRQYDAVRAGTLANEVPALLGAGVKHVLRQYAQACGQI